jgi:hypothetical protein
MNKVTWTDQDVDNLLASVEETIVKAEALAKASPADPAPEDDKDAPPAVDAKPADDAPPAADAAAAAPPADPSAPPAPDAAAAPAEGDQALAQEGGGEDQPLSDEELAQIYGSMPPDELERHYSVIRQALQASYGQDQGAPASPETAAPAPPPAPAPAPGMEKSEQKIAELQKQVADLAAANEQVIKAFEVLAKPARKSITDIQVIEKSDFARQDDRNRPLSTEEIKERAGRLCRNPGSLQKHERDMINRFFIQGEGAQEVEKLIHSKGGN